MSVFIIADIGANHRGEKDRALVAVQAAKNAGADAVKFQLYTYADLYGQPGETPYALDAAWLPELKEMADKVGIEFMATPFSPEGVAAIDPFVARHKLASSEFNHVGIIDAMVATGKPVIVSTGGVGYLDVQWMISYLGVQKCQNVTFLECVAKYPASPSLYNLNCLSKWARGLSDHTTGSAVACAAVGAGATVIEKHFDPFPGQTPTADAPVSLGPVEFRLYVQDVREAASAVGDGIKQPRHQHEMALRWRRRYIATRDIAAGEPLAYGVNFGLYRSLRDDTNGLSPITWPLERLTGRVAARAIVVGDSIGPKEIA